MKTKKNQFLSTFWMFMTPLSLLVQRYSLSESEYFPRPHTFSRNCILTSLGFSVHFRCWRCWCTDELPDFQCLGYLLPNHSSEGGLESHLEMSTPTYMVQSHLFIQNPSPTSRGVPPNIWYTLESHLIKSKFPFSCYKMTITDEQTGRPPLAQATLQIKWNEKLWFVRW